jgi:hypothetical protein
METYLKSRQDLLHIAVDVLKKYPQMSISEKAIKPYDQKYDMLPNIQIENDLYLLRFYERGEISLEQKTSNENEAIFWIIENEIDLYIEKKMFSKYSKKNQLEYNSIIDEEMKQLRLLIYGYIGEPFISMFRTKANKQDY